MFSSVIHAQIEVERSLRGHFGTVLINSKEIDEAPTAPLRFVREADARRMDCGVVAAQQIPASLLLLKEDRLPRCYRRGENKLRRPWNVRGSLGRRSARNRCGGGGTRDVIRRGVLPKADAARRHPWTCRTRDRR